MTRSFTCRTLFVLGLLFLSALLIYLLSRALLVFILTFVAVMLSVVFRSFANVLPLPYKAALPVAVLFILAVLIGFGWYEGPRLLAQLQGLSEQLPLSVQRLEQELMQAPGGEWLVGNTPFLSLPTLALKGAFTVRQQPPTPNPQRRQHNG